MTTTLTSTPIQNRPWGKIQADLKHTLADGTKTVLAINASTGATEMVAWLGPRKA